MIKDIVLKVFAVIGFFTCIYGIKKLADYFAWLEEHRVR